MKFIKYTIWPMISGIIGLATFFIVMNVSISILEFLASIPLLGLVLLLNIRILGVDILTIEAFTIGSVAAMCLMNLLTKYDYTESHNCYKKASRACGVIYAILLVPSIFEVYEASGMSLGLLTSFVPFVIFGILLFSGSKFE